MKLTTQYVRWRVEFWRDSVGLFTSENIYVVEREKVYKKSSWVNFFSHTQKQIVDIVCKTFSRDPQKTWR